jgi:hypothetical protein
MKKKKPLIPFNWLPASWGLKGKTRERAQAEYELGSGIELDKRLAKIDAQSEHELKGMLLEIDLQHGVIDRNTYDRKYAEELLEKDSDEQKRELLRLDHLEHKITDLQYEKEIATLNGESWVHMLSIKPDSAKPNHGEMELDWNEKFVEELREGGYEGVTDDMVVDLWLADLCRNIAMEQFTGTGDFDEKVPDQFIHKTPIDDQGKWEAK